MKNLHKISSTAIMFLMTLPMYFSACQNVSHHTNLAVDKMYSNALEEVREYCVYLPENFDPATTYPVIFSTDGQIIASGGYEAILNSLIKDKAIPPVILVAANSNETKIGSDGLELRYYEYIYNEYYDRGNDDSDQSGEKADPRIAGRFRNHMEFFTHEIRDSILTKYSIKPDEKKMIFYGCSNGGDYGLTLYSSRHDLFTDYICLSPVGTQADTFNLPPAETDATLYVAYGSKEAERPVIGDNLRALGEKLNTIGNRRITVDVYEGGHDRKCWEKAFTTALIAILK